MADVEGRLRAEGERWRASLPAPPDPGALPDKRPRAPRAAWWLAAAAAFVVLAVVVGAAVVTRPAPPVASPGPSVSPSGSPSASSASSSPSPAAAAPPCRGRDLVAEPGDGEGVGGGLALRIVLLLNTGDATCSLTGRPLARAEAADGRRVRVGAFGDIGYVGPARNVAPGKQAAFVLAVRNDSWCDDPPTVRRLVLEIEGDDVEVARPGRVCEVSVGTYGSTAERDDPVTEPVTWSATIASPDARPGTMLDFRVTLTNSGDEALSVWCGQTYRVRLAGQGPAADQRRLPACKDPHGSIVVEPGGSRTILATVYVPNGVASGPAELLWTLDGATFRSAVRVSP